MWTGLHIGQVNTTQLVKKRSAMSFNILYYDPLDTEFQRWKYGIDIIAQIKEQLSDVNWLKADGTQDMRELYAITDLYIRPRRHDGEPRINVECKLNSIPVIYSENGNPSAEHFIKEINLIKTNRHDPSLKQ